MDSTVLDMKNGAYASSVKLHKEACSQFGEQECFRVNDVCQINEQGPEGWVGCFVQIDEVRTWGIQAWVKMPRGGNAYIRLTWDQIDWIGRAVLVPEGSEIQTDEESR